MAPRSPDDSPIGDLASVLRDVVDLVGADPTAAPSDELRRVVLLLAQASGQLDAELTRWVDAFDAQTVWLGDGARSAGGWMAARTELSAATGAAITHRSRALRACPVVAAAFRAGHLGTATVRLLVRAREAHRVLFAEHEAGLVAEIAPLTVDQASQVIARWEALAQATADAEGPDEPPEDPATHNALFASETLGGRVVLDGDLDPVSGAEVRNAIDAEIDRLFNDGIYRSDDGIAASRRRAEALVDLVRRGARPGATKHGDPRPSVSLIIDHRTLAGDPATDLADGLARRCELVDGSPILPATAHRLLCNARVSALLIKLHEDGSVETLGVTDLLRDATARQRRALRARDGGCVFSGCTARVDWCDAHHLHPAELDGPTLMVNLVLLCKHHHHLVHEGGWRLWRSDDGTLRLATPDQRHVPLAAHGAKVPAQIDWTSEPDGVPPPIPPPLPVRVRFQRAADSGGT